MFLYAYIWLYMFEVMVFCVIYAHFIFAYSLLVSTYHLMSKTIVKYSGVLLLQTTRGFVSILKKKNRNTV